MSPASIVRWLAMKPRWGWWYVVLLTALLLVPEAHGEHGRRASGWLAVPRHPLSPGAVRDVLLNIAIFLPAGAWLAGGRRQLRGPARAALALVLGAGFSVLLESLQYLLGWRHSSLMDVGANATGVLLGAMLAVALAGRPSRDVRPTAVSPRR